MSSNVMVYKSNSLVEASYRLSVVEQRIILACISQVPHGEPVTDEIMYSVSAQDIAKLSETDSKTTYRDLAEATLRLKRREVRIEFETNSKRKRKKVMLCGWVQTVEYVEDEGHVNLRFNKDMLPYLTELSKHFTKYRLDAVVKMDSSYGIRLYELLIQWQRIGKREISIVWLREVFQLDDKYPAIKDFKKYVIDIAVTQINDYSDLTCSYTQRKTGRTVTHITFEFAPKDAAKDKPAQKAPIKAKTTSQSTAKPSTKAIPLTAETTDKPRTMPPEVKAALAAFTNKMKMGQSEAKPTPPVVEPVNVPPRVVRTRAEIQAAIDELRQTQQ